MIKLDNVVATYTTQRGQVSAVDGIDLEVIRGRRILRRTFLRPF